jgi:hypothetical protein
MQGAKLPNIHVDAQNSSSGVIGTVSTQISFETKGDDFGKFATILAMAGLQVGFRRCHSAHRHLGSYRIILPLFRYLAVSHQYGHNAYESAAPTARRACGWCIDMSVDK